MQKVNTFSLVVVVCASALTTGPVWGSYMTYNGMGWNSQVRIHADGLLADGLRTRAGQLMVGYEGQDYLAYCVDLDHYVKSAEMVSLNMNSINNGDLVAFLYDTYAAGVNSGLDAAALGVAIWEVVHETGDTFDAGTGYFSVSENQAVLNRANALLGALDSIPSSYTPSNGLKVLHGQGVQSVVVPEPSVLALLGAGVAGFIAKRRTWTH